MDHKYYPIALLFLRFVFGFRLIYGVIDNVISWEQMLEFESFLRSNSFPLPLFSAILSVYLQLLAGLSWIMGFQVKVFSVMMALNFTTALVAVHFVHGDDYFTAAPALHLLSISLFLVVSGPGKFSLDFKKTRT